MGEKKRKDLPTSSDEPKKSKKAKVVAEPAPAAPAVSAPAEPSTKTKATKKSGRGRAADYMNGNEEPEAQSARAPAAAAAAAAVAVSKKAASSKSGTKGKKEKNKKSKLSSHDETLTADGANGIIEHADTEEVEALPGTLQAEAQNTVDAELREEYGSGDEGDQAESGDVGAALLAGFDSDTSDHAEDTGLDVDNLGGIPHYKKTKKKLSKIVKSGNDKPGTVYVGRIPHGFYEQQMREYFSQFGDITRLRLSRNRRTGASKHFAFVEFASEEVAKIVAETMDNYLMFGHILKCKFAPTENLHPDVWKGANKKFRKIPYQKLERQKLEASKTVDQWEKKNKKENKKRGAKAKALKEKLGYDAPVVELTKPAMALKANELEAQKAQAAIEAAPAEEVSTATTTTPAIEATKETPAAADAPKEAEKQEASEAKPSKAKAADTAVPEAKKAVKKAKKEAKAGKKAKAQA